MTRIGLIADIHGNAFALDTVLHKLGEAGVDEIVCLGDLAVLGPEPAEVLALLRKRGVTTVCGNTDAWIRSTGDMPAEPPTSRESQELTTWTLGQLEDLDRTWIDTLPRSLEREIHGWSVCFCHGSPGHVDDIIVNLPVDRVGEFGFDIVVGGHTHQQVEVAIGQVRYLNPGSAGLPGVGPGDGIPIHRGATWVEFAVLDLTPAVITWEPHRTAIDVNEMFKRVRESGMPHQSWWTSLWG